MSVLVTITQQVTSVTVTGTTVAVTVAPVMTTLTIAPGITDHGALTGLADDDHPQYLTQAEGDARYALLVGGADAYYRHVQGAPATVWTVTHNLSKFPAVSAADSTGRQVYGQVDYINTNTVQLTFSAGFAGEAYCS